jgi:hypothetical protein
MNGFRLVVVLLVAGLALGSTSVRAEDEDLDSRHVRTVFRLGTLGATAGAGAGLVMWPISGRVNTLFVGAGVGFVIGALAGIYHVNHEDDPQNPLRGVGLSLPIPGEAGASPVAVTWQLEF